jgi:hypothetical protein
MLGFQGPAQPSPTLGDALNAGHRYPEVRCLGCNTHQTGTRGSEPRSAIPVSTGMKYRGVEYALIQGLGRQVWKWSISLDADHSATGQAATKAEAASQAERAIDRAQATALATRRRQMSAKSAVGPKEPPLSCRGVCFTPCETAQPPCREGQQTNPRAGRTKAA